MKKRAILLLLAVISLSFALAACGQAAATAPATTAPATSAATDAASDEPAANPDEPVYGGVLKVSINQDPVSLDAVMESGENEQIPSAHIFETALALDKSGAAYPGVCDFTFDGTTLTLSVREGVTFHNGDPVEIADVDASMTRWLANVSFASTHLGDKIATREIVDGKLVITLSSPAPLALTALGRYAQGLYIMQEEICTAKPDTKITQEEYIGTGPYKFVEHLADRYVRIERYDGYVATTAEADGRAEPKKAYADEIYFYPVPDRTARITGVQTGEFDVAIGVPANMMPELSADENLVVEVKDLGIMAVMVFNSSQGLGTDVNLRKAILACVDMEEAMLAAQGDPSLYYLNPNMMTMASRWYNDAGSDMYNVKDIEKAKEYLAASAYNGETLRFVTTQDNDYFYKTAMVVAESAKEIGIDIDVQVFDNATLRQYREDPTMFEMFSGGIGPYDDPTLIGFLDSSWPGLYDSERKNEVLDKLLVETDDAKRLELWAELSQVLYDDLPVVTFGERRNPIVYRNYVHNLFSTTEKIYWNSWISE